MRTAITSAALAALTTLTLAGPALADPPSNDNRAAAQVLSAGADISGTTVEATREPSEPSSCGATKGPSVWYSYEAPRSGPMRLLLETQGKLDATVAIYEVDNSTITPVTCQSSRRSRAFLTTQADQGGYLIQVSQRDGSQAGTFRLRFSGVLTPPKPANLPASGQVHGTLDALTRPFLRVQRTLHQGTPYRVRVAVGKNGSCAARIHVSGPGYQRYFGCRDYAVVTPGPGEGGKYTINVETQPYGASVTQPYAASITRAGADDLAPGRFIAGFGRAHGSVSGLGPDAEDVYRFDVTKRAEITLQLRSAGAMVLRLRTDSGRRVTQRQIDGDSGEIRTRLRPGRFYAIVSAARDSGGSYTLSRLTRVITATTVSWDRAQKAPGGSSTIHVSTSNAANGRAKVTVERFDPQYGWRFYTRKTIPIRGGSGALTVSTADIGRYRARAEYLGTRGFSPSHTRRTAVLQVIEPLKE